LTSLSEPTKFTKTIVITNYNYSQFIHDAIVSALNQKPLIDELVIVDDKSTDNSVVLIEKLLSNLPQNNLKIKFLVHDVNKGLPSSRNTGITNSSGDIIGFLDADDIYYNNKMDMSAKIFEKYPEVSVVYSDYDVQDLQNNTFRREFKFDYDPGLLTQTCIVSTNSVFRRRFFDEIGLYNPEVKVAEDYELYLRAFQTQYFYHLPHSLFKYRLHGKNITLTQYDQMAKNEIEYKRKLLNA
jgi:glycosyltransferase involved in cell wall biosynthesis